MAGSPWQQVGNREWKKVGADLNGRGPTISQMVRNEQINSGRRWRVENWCGANEEPNQSGRWKVIPIGG